MSCTVDIQARVLTVSDKTHGGVCKLANRLGKLLETHKHGNILACISLCKGSKSPSRQPGLLACTRCKHLLACRLSDGICPVSYTACFTCLQHFMMTHDNQIGVNNK